MSTCFLHVSEPADDYDDDSPTILTPPGDRWCSLWAAREPGGPRLPCHPSIEGTATEWLLIAGAIEAGAPRAFDRVAFAPQAGGGEFWSPRNSTGDRDHVRLTTAELVELAAAVRATLAPPIDTTGAPTSAPEPGSLEARLLDLWTRGGAHSSALIPVYLLGASEARASAQPPAVADYAAAPTHPMAEDGSGPTTGPVPGSRPPGVPPADPARVDFAAVDPGLAAQPPGNADFYRARSLFMADRGHPYMTPAEQVVAEQEWEVVAEQEWAAMMMIEGRAQGSRTAGRPPTGAATHHTARGRLLIATAATVAARHGVEPEDVIAAGDAALGARS